MNEENLENLRKENDILLFEKNTIEEEINNLIENKRMKEDQFNKLNNNKNIKSKSQNYEHYIDENYNNNNTIEKQNVTSKS